MRTPIRLMMVLLLSIAIGSQAISTQTGIQIPPEVSADVAANGSALVIVGVRAAFVPEGFLAGPAEVAAQRDAMHAAVESVMGRAAAVGALVGQRFETIPFFTARVDANTLSFLASQPDVTSIGSNAYDRVSLGDSVPLIGAPTTWAAGFRGTGQHVAILDTGVDKTHSFFQNRVVSEACYSNAGGLGTGDGGSSVCPGGVFASTATGSGVNCSASIEGCDHGTHVAGIAAGANGPLGISGVAPEASLIAMQVFTRIDNISICGSTDPCVVSYSSDQVLALERVLAIAGPGNSNHVASANMSLGGIQIFGSPCDAVPAHAPRAAIISSLLSVGIGTTISSGNLFQTTGVSAPACISTAIAVGSSTKSDTMSSFTNRSPTMVDVLAPGSSINSSVLGNAFDTFSGTSMAAPHVAGTLALLKQAQPGASMAQIVSALRTTGTIINDPPSGGTYPRINVNAARLALGGGGTGAPGAPGAPTISGFLNNLTINWTPPATGGAPTSYNLLARLTPGGPLLVPPIPVGNVLSTTINPAPNGTFTVSVQASNASGTGPESAGTTFSVPILPPPPGPPTNLSATVTGNQALFTWTPPATGGMPTHYVAFAALSPGGVPIASLPFAVPPVPQLVVPNIPVGTYYVRLAGVNLGGTGTQSNEVVVTVSPPGPPTLNPASVMNRDVTLSWAAPTTGSAATSYLVAASLTPGGPAIATLPVPGLGITVPAPPGTYFVRVHGVNALGVGPPSNEITVVVP